MCDFTSELQIYLKQILKYIVQIFNMTEFLANSHVNKNRFS